MGKIETIMGLSLRKSTLNIHWNGVLGGVRWGAGGHSGGGSRREAVGLGTLGDFDCPGVFSGEQQGWRQMVQVWVAS